MNKFRGLLFNVLYLTSAILYSIPAILITPFLSYRYRVKYYTTWPKLVQWVLTLTCGIRYQVIGGEHIPDRPVVVISNHQSSWETFLMFTLFTPITAVLKKELVYIPIFGWLLLFTRPIRIDRSKRTSALKDLLSQGKERLEQGTSVLIYPEGTRVPVGETRPHFSGGAMLAVKAGYDILPVVHNSGKFWPAHRLEKNPGVITVKVGRPMPTAGRSAKELSKEVETWINQEKEAINQA